MATYRKVHTQFWSDPFVQTLSPEQRYFFLYLLTNEKTRQCGIYEITTRQISYDTGYNVETILILLEFFSSSGKILVSRETNEIAVKNWEKYNKNPSIKVQTLVKHEIATVKSKKLIQYLESENTVFQNEKQTEAEAVTKTETITRAEAVVEVGSEKVKEVANEVWKDQSWKENICIGLTISMDDLKKWLAMFNSSIAGDKVLNFDKSAYKKMSRGWIVSQKQKGTDVESGLKISNAAPLKKLNHD